MNDSLIDFYLKYTLRAIVTDAKTRERFHVFNTFFYTRYRTTAGTPKDKYQRVRCEAAVFVLLCHDSILAAACR
jgi:Ulp1 family protease